MGNLYNQPSPEISGTVTILDEKQDVFVSHYASSNALVDTLTYVVPTSPADSQTLTIASFFGITNLILTTAIPMGLPAGAINNTISLSASGCISWRYDPISGVWFLKNKI